VLLLFEILDDNPFTVRVPQTLSPQWMLKRMLIPAANLLNLLSSGPWFLGLYSTLETKARSDGRYPRPEAILKAGPPIWRGDAAR
jgi:hypothetical protein